MFPQETSGRRNPSVSSMCGVFSLLQSILFVFPCLYLIFIMHTIFFSSCASSFGEYSNERGSRLGVVVRQQTGYVL